MNKTIRVTNINIILVAFVERFGRKQPTKFYIAAVLIVLKLPFRLHACSSQVFNCRSYDLEQRRYTTLKIILYYNNRPPDREERITLYISTLILHTNRSGGDGTCTPLPTWITCDIIMLLSR